MLAIVGQFRVQADRIADFERRFLAYAAKVKANEPGALTYQLNRSRDQAGVYSVIEIYSAEAALQAHRAAAYFRPAIEALGAFMVGEPRVEVYDVVE
jgi:quinol monooxygenase YgiN